MPGSLLGNAVPRVEDPALLTGPAATSTICRSKGALHAHFVRSPIAHGRITEIDVAEALTQPGVVAVYTADDLGSRAAARVHPRAPAVRAPAARRWQGLLRRRSSRGGDRGDARPGRRRGRVGDRRLRPAARRRSTWKPRLRRTRRCRLEALGSNMAVGRREGDGADVLADADVRRARAHREPARRGGADGGRRASRSEPGDRRSVPHDRVPRGADAAPVLERDRDGHGARRTPRCASSCPTSAARSAPRRRPPPSTTWSRRRALRLGRPVKWVETRSENLVAMGHGRGQVQYIEMGFTRDGVITGLRCRMVGDAGAYGGFGGILVTGTTRLMATGVYRVPKLAVRGCGRGHQHHADGRVPRRGPPGGRRVPRAGHGPRRPRARASIRSSSGAGTSSSPTTSRSPRSPARATTAATTTSALARRCASPATTTCAPSRRARRARGDRVQLGIGVAAYVEVTGGGSGTEWGGARGARRRQRDDSRRHVVARAGTRHVVRDDRVRHARHPARPDRASCSPTPR